MKKYVIIMLGCLSPFFMNAESCYGGWINCYNAAESSYASDLNYCSGRGLDTKTLACYHHASSDFGDSIEGCSDSYYLCVIEF